MTARYGRRQVLATVGAAVFAGCSRGSEDGTESFRASELPAVDADPEPAFRVTLPVDVPASYRRRVRGHVETTLDRVPTSLTDDDVPNGHVRKHLNEAAVGARERLDAARDASTTPVTLRALRRARRRAFYVAGGWASIRNETDADSARAVYEAAQDRLGDGRVAHGYLGTDPVPTVVLHACVERRFGEAQDTDGFSPHDDDEVRTLGNAARLADAETVRANVEDAAVLRRAFSDARPSDAGSFEMQLVEVNEALQNRSSNRLEVVETRLDDPEPFDNRVLTRLESWTTTRETAAPSLHSLASRVLRDGRLFATAEGHRTAVARIRSGDGYALSEPGDVERWYHSAHKTLARAVEPGANPHTEFLRSVLRPVRDAVRRADRQLAEADGMVAASALREPVATYVAAAVTADAAPDVVASVVDTLDT